MSDIFRIQDTKAFGYIFERERNLYGKASVLYFLHLHVKKAVSAYVSVSKQKMKGDLNFIKEELSWQSKIL